MEKAADFSVVPVQNGALTVMSHPCRPIPISLQWAKLHQKPDFQCFKTMLYIYGIVLIKIY